MLKCASLGFALALTLLSAAGAAQSRAADPAGATAQAYGIRVIVPGAAGGETPTVSAPPDAVQFSGGFSYNGIVTTGSANASVSAVSGPEATATASAEVGSVTIFGGEITITSVQAQAHADARPGAATGDISGSTVTGLVALGQPVASGASATLADWGSLRTMESGTSGSAATGYRSFVTAVDIHLTADHEGLPAGTSILIGYASVAAQAAPPPPPTTAPGPKPQPQPKTKNKGPKIGALPNPAIPLAPVTGPLKLTPPLHTPGGNVFPVYGPSSYTDTYGAFRSDVAGGWHHGDDIFAPLGAPVLAVASGTVFSVGWNQVGGNRLWLRDGAGNEYYYAHLSAYTPLARNGAVVNAGDVLGFVGNTGDAQGTPYHLHFEVHPVGLLGLGYDGAVDPTTYLNRWHRVQDVSFAGGIAWAPARSSVQAPKSGAVLISATDISSADGLDPNSLRRTLAPPRATEGGAR